HNGCPFSSRLLPDVGQDAWRPASGPGDESFGRRRAGGYGGLRCECPVVAAHHVVGGRVDVGVGEVDAVGGYLDVDADRGAEVPGVDVQVDHGDREIVGNGPAERSLHHPAQVGVTEHISGLHHGATPESGRVTFDKI